MYHIGTAVKGSSDPYSFQPFHLPSDLFPGILDFCTQRNIQKLFIQLIYGRYVRDRHEEISSDKSYLQTFYKPFFMPLCRIAEYWFEGIVCRQGKIFVCCFCMTSKSFFYSNTSIIKNDLLRRSAKKCSSPLRSFQKAFFILPVSGNKDIPAVAFTHVHHIWIFCLIRQVLQLFHPNPPERLRLGHYRTMVQTHCSPCAEFCHRPFLQKLHSHQNHIRQPGVCISYVLYAAASGAFWSESRQFGDKWTSSSVM